MDIADVHEDQRTVVVALHTFKAFSSSLICLSKFMVNNHIDVVLRLLALDLPVH